MTKLVGLFVVLAVAAVLAGWVLRRLNTDPGRQTFPYMRRPLLTPNEKDFYRALVIAAGRDAIVLAQVPIGSFADPKDGIQNRQAARNRIDRKTVDFLLVDPQSLDPIAAIEVNDRSHNTRKRTDRDAFVVGVLKAIELPLHQFPASRGYSPPAIRAQLFPWGGAGETSPASQSQL